MLLDWGAAVDKVWGTLPSSRGPDSPPLSNWDSKKFTTSEHSASSFADPEETFVDLLDVKDEISSSGVVVHRKRRKSKSPKFTVSISLKRVRSLKLLAGGDPLNGQSSGTTGDHDGQRRLFQ